MLLEVTQRSLVHVRVRIIMKFLVLRVLHVMPLKNPFLVVYVNVKKIISMMDQHVQHVRQVLQTQQVMINRLPLHVQLLYVLKMNVWLVMYVHHVLRE